MGAIAEGFAAFARPLLEQTDGSLEQMNKAFAIAQLCFNLAMLPEANRRQTLSELRADLAMDDKEFEEFQSSVVVPMIRRHEEIFPQMHRRASAGPLPSGPALPAPPRRAAPAERRTGIDRYAPCPCNSGKKYKFCCGMKKGR